MLELDDKAPVVLGELVSEVLLEGIDTLPADLADQLVRVVKVATIRLAPLVSAECLDFDGHSLTSTRKVHRLQRHSAVISLSELVGGTAGLFHGASICPWLAGAFHFDLLKHQLVKQLIE